MHDMLVKLYELETWLGPRELMIPGFTFRKPIGAERDLLVEWVAKKFSGAWASETAMALSNRPLTCCIAVKGRKPVGFSCYDATARGFFGPMGIEHGYRGKGIGRILLFTSLFDMRNCGYGYAIIGGVGPAEFYKKTLGAVDIPGSDSSIWATWIQ